MSTFSSSISVCEADSREENLAEAGRLVESGPDFDTDRIRVFGGGDTFVYSTDELALIGGETVHEILAIDGADASPTETLDAIGDQLAYVHLKDAVSDPDRPGSTDGGYVYTLPGEGELPMDEVLRELRYTDRRK